MNQMDLAKKLGISQGWLWKIYNGYATPGKAVAIKLWKATGHKDWHWWREATVKQIQKALDAVK